MSKNDIFDLIITLVKGAKKSDKRLVYDEKCVIGNCDYLLGQVLRQYQVSDDNWYISEKACNLWDSIAPNKNIWDYVYKKKFECANRIKIKRYIGNNSNPEEKYYEKGEKIEFRSVFHDDHIMDIATIKRKLKDLKDLDYENVENILNNICIARILKEEDKRIKKYNRGDSKEEAMEAYIKAEGGKINLIPKLSII